MVATTAMADALAVSRNDEINRPSVGSATWVSFAAVWLAGEKAIKNSGKAISSAVLSLASRMSFPARLRFSLLSVEDWVWVMAILLIGNFRGCRLDYPW